MPQNESASRREKQTLKKLAGRVGSFLKQKTDSATSVVTHPIQTALGPERQHYSAGKLKSASKRTTDNAPMSSGENNPYVWNYTREPDKVYWSGVKKQDTLPSGDEQEQVSDNPEEVIQDVADLSTKTPTFSLMGHEYAIHPDDVAGDGPVRYMTGDEGEALMRGQWSRDQYNSLRAEAAAMETLMSSDEDETQDDVVPQDIAAEGDADNLPSPSAEQIKQRGAREAVAGIDMILHKIQQLPKKLIGVEGGLQLTEDEKGSLMHELEKAQLLLQGEISADPVFKQMLRVQEENSHLISFTEGWVFAPNDNTDRITKVDHQGATQFEVPGASYDLYVAADSLRGIHTTLGQSESETRGTSTRPYVQQLTRIKEHLQEVYLSS